MATDRAELKIELTEVKGQSLLKVKRLIGQYSSRDGVRKVYKTQPDANERICAADKLALIELETKIYNAMKEYQRAYDRYEAEFGEAEPDDDDLFKGAA